VRERVRARDIIKEEGNRLLRIVRRSSGSVVTWRRAQMVLLSARGTDVGKIPFTSPDRVREVLHDFKRRRLRLPLAPLQRWPPADVHPAQRRKAKKLALSRLADHELPSSTWSL
jgi:hypothetical protein